MKQTSKKMWLLAVVSVFALLSAGPVMAMDIDFSGSFRLRGVKHDNPHPPKRQFSTQAWYDVRLRLKTIFDFNDNISLIARVDAMENSIFGSQNFDIERDYYHSHSGVNFDMLYALFKTPYGAFSGGRTIGSQWGPSPMGDSNLISRDRFMWDFPWDSPIGPLVFGGYLEKHHEHQFTSWRAKADRDNDRYAAFIQYEGENLQAGLMAALYDYQSIPMMSDYYRYVGRGEFVKTNVDADIYLFDPYVAGRFGPFSYFAEAIYAFGQADYRNRDKSVDINAFTYHLESKYKFGPATLRAGYWFMSGDNNTEDNNMKAFGFLESSKDMDRLLILTGNPHKIGGLDSLGDVGNFSSGGISAWPPTRGMLATAGAKVIYAGLEFRIMDNLHLDVTYGRAWADKPPGSRFYDYDTRTNLPNDWDNFVGNEYNLTLKWSPIKNLEYKIMGGYLDPGGFWKKGRSKSTLKEMYALLHEMTLTF